MLKFKVHVNLCLEKCNREYDAQCKVLFFKKCNSFFLKVKKYISIFCIYVEMLFI